MKMIVDSGSDLTLSQIEEKGFYFLPFGIVIDDQNKVDQYEISNEEVLAAIKNNKHPKTNQATMEQMTKVFTEVAEKKEQAIYLAFSSALSGTYQTACLVKEQVKETYPDLDLTIYDTLSASMGCGKLILDVQDKIEQSYTFEELDTYIKERIDKIRHLFTVKDLNYLASGGRLSKGQAFLGNLLNIKPLLHVEEGKLVPIEKHRGSKKLWHAIIDKMKKENSDYSDDIIYMTHADDIEEAEKIKELIQSNLSPKDVVISNIGPVICSHTGSGTVAIFYYKE
ncbi:DegV family protein [Mammaliicoccus sciuri]|uniref:DegV family protein n=1 Tax=Mammaliicoccus sciuri TaxID=1296 RepID=A0AB37HLC6_MAMSC|nr:DegV family protein [Mammaliicoccus sciuri]MCE4979979.1 DegV family protein [Mammaliicoccus sciuri]MCE5084604.1 DegV family protein [Mammaliicoccus sciuri]MCE5094348.1 DegV family protein [Mammaliicoccus sciuri]MDT0710837.1 DegV family protein [Mammaliicoccus sciuri]MEB6255408.1 DegV family protein [Mammaliicoccus sciuri]